MIRDIRWLVEQESPSDSPALVNRAMDVFIKMTSDIASARTFEGGTFGKHLLLEFQGAGDGGRILGLGHMDTVWPAGTLSTMPWRQTDDRLWGPGLLDMKAGLILFIYAVRLMREQGLVPRKQISLLVVSEEEVGSPESRTITEREALRSDCVLVLEPGTGLSGKLKTARKGVGRYVVTVTGKAAHAGVDFADGASALIEIAHVIERCAELTDTSRGITVNPGVVEGGSRSNVVPDRARLEVDVRAVTASDASWVDQQIRSLRPRDERCTISVEGGINRPPMVRTAAISALFEKARIAGQEMDLWLEESATGGGSDGSFTAALGVPTLDGIGAVGEGAHAAHESVLVSCLEQRTALLAKLLAEL